MRVLLPCRGGALYCGISNRPDERFAAHRAGARGAKFTRMHKPQEMRLLYAAISRSEAARIEPSVKKLAPEQKRRLWAALAELAAQHHAHTEPKPRAGRVLDPTANKHNSPAPERADKAANRSLQRRLSKGRLKPFPAAAFLCKFNIFKPYARIVSTAESAYNSELFSRARHEKSCCPPHTG